MTDPSYAALRRHNERIAAMLTDPDCVGDLLLVGMVFARCVDLGDPPMNHVVREAGTLLYGAAEHGPHLHRWRYEEHFQRIDCHSWRRVKDVLRSDIRRYEPDISRAYFCQRPVKVRQRLDDGPTATNIMYADGAQPAQQPARPETVRKCGRTTATAREHMFIDPVDGTRTALGACSQPRCQAWWRALQDRNEQEVAANPPPEPVANRGGVLERHLDEIDWWKLWQHLDPTWKPPHEAPGWRPPKLQILLTDDPDLAVTERPTFTVVKGGWT